MLLGEESRMKHFLAVVMSFFTVLALTTAPFALEPSPSAPVYDGADVSVFQGEIDFVQLREAVEVVYIRAGFGETADSRFAENAAKAAAADIHRGFYFYVTARSEAEAEAQAHYFASLLSKTQYDCRPAMDFEAFDGLSVREIRTIGLTFLRALEEETGSVPLLYADAWAASAVWNDTDFSTYPLWAAAYGAEEPEVEGEVWSGWAGFQYTDQGDLPGITGRVDLDRFTGTVLLTKEWTEENTYTVQPGDTLWGIARQFHTTVFALVMANDIQNPNLIYPSQILRIPESGGGEPAFEHIYRIQPGDTLWGIARQFHTTVSVLTKVNGIQNPNLIYPGQTIRVP